LASNYIASLGNAEPSSVRGGDGASVEAGGVAVIGGWKGEEECVAARPDRIDADILTDDGKKKEI